MLIRSITFLRFTFIITEIPDDYTAVGTRLIENIVYEFNDRQTFCSFGHIQKQTILYYVYMRSADNFL